MYCFHSLSPFLLMIKLILFCLFYLFLTFCWQIVLSLLYLIYGKHYLSFIGHRQRRFRHCNPSHHQTHRLRFTFPYLFWVFLHHSRYDWTRHQRENGMAEQRRFFPVAAGASSSIFTRAGERLYPSRRDDSCQAINAYRSFFAWLRIFYNNIRIYTTK